jgi:hypothetical protein
MSVDMEKIKDDWRARGFGCDLWVDPPGKCWEGHIHEVDALLTVLEGFLEVEVFGDLRRPAPGEEVFLPAKAVHSIRNAGGGFARWLYGHKKIRRDPDACL